MPQELRLLVVKPHEISPPTVCDYPECGGRHLRLHQGVSKPLRHTVYQTVTARRYQCRSLS